MKEKNQFFYETEIAFTMGMLHRELANRLDEMCAGGKLNISHIIVLELLLEKGSSSMSELAKVLNLTMGAATAIADKMVGLDLVKRERSTKDRRVVDVSLTKKGKDAASKTASNRLEMVKDIFSVLTKEEKSQYLGLLKKVHNGLLDKKND